MLSPPCQQQLLQPTGNVWLCSYHVHALKAETTGFMFALSVVPYQAGLAW